MRITGKWKKGANCIWSVAIPAVKGDWNFRQLFVDGKRAIRLENANHCRVEKCHIEHVGGYAFWLHLDSRCNVIDRNTVLYSGGGGVLFTGARLSYMDDSKLYAPGELAATVFPILNRVTRNTVKHCGKLQTSVRRPFGSGINRKFNSLGYDGRE